MVVALDVEQLYRRYGAMVHRRCRSILRDDELAHDAAQDVFVRVIRNEHRLTEDAPSRLLWTLATNVSLNYLRTRKRKPEDGDALLGEIAAMDDLAGLSAVRALAARLLGEELPSTRVIATLHFVDGHTLEEVAEMVGMSVSGVRKRLRGLKERARALDGGEHVPG